MTDDRLTDAELDELESVAKAATQGDWRGGIAAFDPPTGLALVREVRELRKEKTDYARRMSRLEAAAAEVARLRDVTAPDELKDYGGWRADQEVIALRAENARLREALGVIYEFSSAHCAMPEFRARGGNYLIASVAKTAAVALQSTHQGDEG